MSQKINPISFRLGLFQVWNTTMATYSKKTDFYYLHKKKLLENYLKAFFVKENIYLGNTSWVISPKKASLVVICSESFKSSIQIKTTLKKLNILLNKVFKILFDVYLIKHSLWSSSSELIKRYVLFNVNQNLPLKSILKNTSKLISNQLGTKKVLYTIKGPLNFELQGFKYQLSGRFDNSRNQMTKTIKYTEGTLPMPSMRIYVEYSQTHIHTKSGVCGLHIWLTYTTQQK